MAPSPHVASKPATTIATVKLLIDGIFIYNNATSNTTIAAGSSH